MKDKLRKYQWLMLGEYALALLLDLFGMLVFSWALQLSGGDALYTVLFTLILAGFFYSRAWNLAKADKKLFKETGVLKNRWRKLILPTLCVLGFVALFYLFVWYNWLPVRDWVMSAQYIFPEGAPRKLVSHTFMDYLTPFVRVFFCNLLGLANRADTPLVFFINPLLLFLCAPVGYRMGLKGFLISDKLAVFLKKTKDKFNE
jgi:hypothetical protein